MKSKDLLEKKFKDDMIRDIINRYVHHCDSLNSCKECEYSNNKYYQYDYQYECMARFVVDNFNVSYKKIY